MSEGLKTLLELGVILEFSALCEDDEFTKEQKRKDIEHAAAMERRYKEQKILDQQMEEILLGHIVDRRPGRRYSGGMKDELDGISSKV